MSDAPKILPCPFCGGTSYLLEPLGQIWRGMRGYSDPVGYELQHHGKAADDPFLTCHVVLRARNKYHAVDIWNTHALKRGEGLDDE